MTVLRRKPKPVLSDSQREVLASLGLGPAPESNVVIHSDWSSAKAMRRAVLHEFVSAARRG